MRKETRNKIFDIAQQIVTLAKAEGEEMLIGIGIIENDENGEKSITEGAVASEKLEYGDACKMLVGITGYVAEYYGGKMECGNCEEDKPWKG